MTKSQPSFFDAVEPGISYGIGSYTFLPESIKKFAAKYDPQRFHLDEDAAKQSIFGGLCASGWHTLSVWMRLYVDNGRNGIIAATGFEGDLPEYGPSPGVGNIKWLKPVMAGDTISYRSTVTSKRISKSRPGWGLLMQKSEGENERGEMVVSVEGAGMLRTD